MSRVASRARCLLLLYDALAALKVRYGVSSSAATLGKRPESLRVFGCLPGAGARGCTEAGVRKALREETAGEFAPTLVSVYGDLGAVCAVIFRFSNTDDGWVITA